MNTIGIDPGKKGAISVLYKESLLTVVSLEGLRPVDMRAVFNTMILNFPNARVFIEDVHASPQMGVTSAFSFGKGFGELVAFALSFYGEVTLVRPTAWQSALGCLSGGDKGKLFEFAKSKYPEEYRRGVFKRDQADAILIGLYGATVSKFN